MYFKGNNRTNISCSKNTYSYFRNNVKGGVFQLEFVNFNDIYSQYKNNSAQQGGAISCLKC
jgi:hypothetical protein